MPRTLGPATCHAKARDGDYAAMCIGLMTRAYHDLVMPMRVREVIRLLEKHGWLEMRSRGSHRHFKHPERVSVITVPGNDGKELAPGTLNDILKKAGLK